MDESGGGKYPTGHTRAGVSYLLFHYFTIVGDHEANGVSTNVLDSLDAKRKQDLETRGFVHEKRKSKKFRNIWILMVQLQIKF